MDWIERYVRETGRRLPRRLRADVEAELRSSLEDSMENRRHRHPDADEESLTLGLLAEMGPPKALAASYFPPRYLVGPDLYPAFILTLGICLAVVGGIVVFGLAIGTARSAPGATEIPGILGNAATGLFDASVQVLGWLVVIFALVERFAGPRTADEPPDWSPRSLPPVSDPDQVGRSGLLAVISCTALGLIALNMFPEWIGSAVTSGPEVLVIPFLGPGFWRELPLLNLFLGSTVVLSLLLLWDGRWRPLTRWLDLAATLILLAWLLRLWAGGEVTAAGTLRVWSSMVRIGLAAGLVGAAVTAAIQLRRAVLSTWRPRSL